MRTRCRGGKGHRPATARRIPDHLNATLRVTSLQIPQGHALQTRPRLDQLDGLTRLKRQQGSGAIGRVLGKLAILQDQLQAFAIRSAQAKILVSASLHDFDSIDPMDLTPSGSQASYLMSCTKTYA